MNDSFLKVGGGVRVPRDSKTCGRATIATISGSEVSLFLETLAPQSLQTIPKTKKRRLERPFLVTPLSDSKNGHEEEITVAVTQVKPLLDFEQNSFAEASNDADNLQSVKLWKSRGDQLLKLGDPSAACSYYEVALHLSSILQVGSAIIVKQGGHAKLAEIDCLDEDDIEITMLDTQEETSVQQRDVMCCILYLDAEDHVQERILLNLTRCLLQLADLAKTAGTSLEERPRYFRSAVLATTLALTIADFHKRESDDENDNNRQDLTRYEQTALLLRSQGQAGLAKYPHALADVKRLLAFDSQHKEAKRQLKSLQTQQQRQKQVDKRLVRDVCQWVQKSATEGDPVSSAATVGSAEDNDVDDGEAKNEQILTPKSNIFPTTLLSTIVYVVLPIVVGFLVQKLLG